MTQPVVAIDIDEVLFPFTPHINEYYNQRHGTRLTLADYVHFSLDDVWGAPAGTANQYVTDFLSREHRHILPVEQAVAALEQLRRHYRLVVVTARDGQMERQTKQWLLHHFPDFFDDIVLAGNSFTGRGFRAKAEVCRDLGAVYLVDDGLHNITECAAVGVSGLLFGEYPWNQTTEPLPANVQRVADWDEATQVLLEQL
jgi:uncharacterized HAD superfamily protein